MRIGFDAKRLYNNFTGLGNYSRSIVGNLHTFFPDHHYYLYSPVFKQNKHTDPFFNPDYYTPRFPKTRFKSIWRRSGVKRMLKEDKIDLFHGLSHEIPLGMDRLETKTVVTMHDLIFKRYPETYPFLDRQIYDIKCRHACKNADIIISISESTKRDLEHYYDVPEHKIRTIYQPCQDIYYDQVPADDAEVHKVYEIPTDYMLYVGSIAPRKNIRNILRSLSIMSSALRVPCVFVGRGNRYANKMIELSRNLGLNDLTFWIESLEKPEHLRALYDSALFTIYPSFYEGFGLPVAESLLRKTAVITSTSSSMPEAAGPGAVLVNPVDPAEMARAMESLLIDSQMRENIASKGYNYVSNLLNPEKLTRELMDSYRDLVD